MKLLVDGDILCYRFAYSNTVEYDWEDGEDPSVIDFPEEAVKDVDNYIQWLLSETECDVPFICLSSDTNFRYSVDPTYKHNRAGVHPPALTKVIRRYLEENYQSRIMPRLEADDTMGILQTKNPNVFKIASIDKDMKQIPGYLFNWNKGEEELITPFMADYHFYLQILMGDSTDGYSGCPGIGPKKAAAMLDCTPVPYWWQEVVAMFEAKGLTEENAITQARLAKILRASDYDFVNKEVILWEP